MTDKVIEFPKHKVVRDVPGEVLEERARRADQKMADAIVSDITAMILTELDNFYVSVEDETFTKDLVLVVDALKVEATDNTADFLAMGKARHPVRLEL